MLQLFVDKNLNSHLFHDIMCISRSRVIAELWNCKIFDMSDISRRRVSSCFIYKLESI